MSSFLANLWRSFRFPANLQLRIMRLFNDEFLIGVTGVIFNDKGQVLLLKHTYRQIEWSLPGGYLQAKEHPSEGLEREVMEETGLTISADKLLSVRTDRATGRLDMCYMGVFIGGKFKKSKEVIGYQFHSFDTLPLLLPDQALFINEALVKLKKSP